ncbi:MAG: YlzJ-like family protein [Bacillota bacterium]|nr:YlzJ-like family protein [Bacillota bacterium]MDW7682507.1 YlzJ-like family protein [Bacillota bacterium]
MLWTVMPIEAVMDGSDTYQPAYQEIPWKNGMLMVEETGRNTARVVRLISSDPMYYLDPEIQPGSIIEYNVTCRAAKL